MLTFRLIHNNKLSGSIPESIGNLTKLNRLFLIKIHFDYIYMGYY